MKPIWYFVGLLLLSMGMIVLVSGIMEFVDPPTRSTVLAHLRPSLWWGGMMMASGLLFLLMNRRKKVE
jgi:hypothetical protein